MGIMSDFIVKDDTPPPRYPRYPSRHRIDDEDEETLYRDDESYGSDAESIASSVSSHLYGTRATTWMDDRLLIQPGDTDPRKHVLECWKLSMVPATQEIIGGTKVLGVNIKEWDQCGGQVTTRGMMKNPSDLSEMYQNAIASHEAKTRRSWPVRVVRGKAQSYEQDLEKRCKKLPIELQNSVKDLLANRENSSSTPYRHRTWTVVYMEERYVHRFTRTQGAKVNRHKIRFWKNPKDLELTEYYIIIRGAETGLAEGMSGYTKPSVWTNPWRDFDARESRTRTRKQDRLRRRAENSRRRARSISRPRDRSRYRRFESNSPSPRQRRQPLRNRSCDSYTFEDNYSWRRRDQDDYAPNREPEFRSRPRFFNPFPMPNRPVVSHFPPAPTPPESFTPPPGVSRFCVPPPPPPPPPADWYTPSFAADENPFMTPRFPNPFQSAGPCPPYLPFQAPPPPPTELPSSSACFPPLLAGTMCHPPPPPLPLPRFPPPPKLKSFCQACKATPSDCGHFPGIHCFRPVRYTVFPTNGESHPECLACRNWSVPPRPQFFGEGAPTAYTFTNCDGGRPPPPPPMCEDLDEDEDNTTVLDEDDDDDDDNGDEASVRSEENQQNEDEDDEDTQVGEAPEAPSNEKEA